MSRKAPRQVRVTIEHLAEDGLGEALVDGRLMRVRDALPGESVDAHVHKRRRGTWLAQAGQPIDAPAAARRTPACPNFPRCGGCAMQHLEYAGQLEHKQAQLLARLAEQDIVPARLRAPGYGPQFHYRFKARLGVRWVGEQLLAGFRESFSARVARMDDCKTLAQPFARALPALKAALSQLARADQIPQVELAAGDHEQAYIVRHLTPLDEADRQRLRDFARITGSRVYLQPGGYETVELLAPGHVPTYLNYANPDYGLRFDFLPTDFTQVNPYVNRMLVRAAVLGLGDPPAGSTVSDLFCGIGNFSLALARAGFRVRGVESAAGAVDRARHNARLNGLGERAEFGVADLYDARCAQLAESEYLLLDPPRSGAGPNLDVWAAWPALRRIAYVSCNPRTFASDAAVLARHGFRLQEVGIFDMFPHTAHVETLGIFSRDTTW